MANLGRTPFILVDRAALGGFEIWHDGYPAVVFPPGEIEVTVWGDVLDHIFMHDHAKVHTTDGDYVYRVAVKATAGTKAKDMEFLAQHYGPHVLDQSPIEIDTLRREGWDTRDLDAAKRRYIDINVPASEMRERLGSSTRVSFAER